MPNNPDMPTNALQDSVKLLTEQTVKALETAWLQGMREGAEMCAKITDEYRAKCDELPLVPPFVPEMLIDLSGSFRLAAHALPTAVEKPTE